MVSFHDFMAIVWQAQDDEHEKGSFMKESLWVDFLLPFFIIVLLTVV